MDLRQQAENWDAMAGQDPFWAVLHRSNRADGRWSKAEFFETGEREAALLVAQAASAGLDVSGGALLDFGCGVGRVTQALADRFDRCVGVDVSARMVELARRFNPRRDRCEFRVNASERLDGFASGSFDFVYCNIVLQHVLPRYALGYVDEMLRVLRRGGGLFFQIRADPPAGLPLGLRLEREIRRRIPFRLYRLYRRARYSSPAILATYHLDRESVESRVAAGGGRILRVVEDAVPDGSAASLRYFARKEASS